MIKFPLDWLMEYRIYIITLSDAEYWHIEVNSSKARFFFRPRCSLSHHKGYLLKDFETGELKCKNASKNIITWQINP